jgi:hypothetical protein
MKLTIDGNLRLMTRAPVASSSRASKAKHDDKIFRLHGPFEVPLGVDTNAQRPLRTVDTKSQRDFWDNVVGKRVSASNVYEQDGIYIFAMRGSHGSFTPWYVGKAGRSLKTEVFAVHKLRIFDRVLGQERGTPFLFFITHKKPSRRNLPKAQLSRIENDLIDRAYEKNPRLKNTKNPQRKTAWRLLGLSTGAGKPSREITEYKRLMDEPVFKF